jgi:hypothetical protein
MVWVRGETHPGRLDFTGRVFERLTVINRVGYIGKKTRWFCRCICGNERICVSYQLTRGTVKSCGCLNTENRRRVTRERNEARKVVYWNVEEPFGERLIEYNEFHHVQAWGTFGPPEIAALESGEVVEKDVNGVATKFVIAKNAREAGKALQCPNRDY